MSTEPKQARRTIICFTHLDKLPPIDEWVGDVPHFMPQNTLSVQETVPDEPPEWETSR
jgi:hypothetical protein